MVQTKSKGDVMTMRHDSENTQKERLTIIQHAMTLFEQRLTQDTARAWDSALSIYPNQEIAKSFEYHIKTSKKSGAPTPADIIAGIYAIRRDQWLSANEVWPVCVKAADEAETVVWPNELCQEAFASVRDLLVQKEEQRAFWSFSDTYNRLVNEAIEKHKTPHQSVSLGWGVQHIGNQDGHPEHASFAGFLSHLSKAQNSEEGLQRIRGIKAALKEASAKTRMNEIAKKRQATQEVFNAKRAHAMAAFQEISIG